MKIKIKITLGLGLLLSMVLLLAVLASVYIYVLKSDTRNILVANYNTLEYSRNMLMALDELPTAAKAIQRFQENLQKQQKNITEIGEKEATELLAEHFQNFLQAQDKTALPALMRKDISEIMRLNMQAIQYKSNLANQTAETATFWIGITGTICFLIGFTLLMNLPDNIANPIRALTESIQAIAAKNYSQRIHFESHNEFGALAKSFNTMAEKLEEYNNSNLSKLLFEKKRIETLINNMQDAVLVIDENKKILFANHEALTITALKSEDVVGKFAQEVALSNDLMRHLIKEIFIPTTEKQGKKPLKIYAHNKESYFEKEIAEISLVPTGEKEAKHLGHLILLKNITPFKELDFAKTNFIATISHELKTPISSIKMSLQLLENERTGSINEEQKQLINSIKDDTHRLLKIIGELLNLSQVETGNIQLNIQASNPHQILQYSLEAVKIPLEQKQIVLKTLLPETLPAIKADAEKTTWVLINLLANAIRYSPAQSEILIQMKAENEKIIFSVKDSGKGIEPRYKEKIFDRYFQIPQNGTFSSSGTGLGLAISKEFIEAQGGSIEVESEVGLGSCFWFTLPLAA